MSREVHIKFTDQTFACLLNIAAKHKTMANAVHVAVKLTSDLYEIVEGGGRVEIYRSGQKEPELLGVPGINRPKPGV